MHLLTNMTIWTNAHLSDDTMKMLRADVGAHPVAVAVDGKTSNLHPGASDPQMASAGIAFGQPDTQQVIELPNLKWVHLSSAGYSRYDNDAVRAALKARGGILTNSSSVYNDPCAQHALAMMLAGARNLPEAYREHHGARGWHNFDVRAGSYLLTNQSVLIYGYGAIARRLVELLQPFRMQITAVRRTVRGDENAPTTTLEAAEKLLPHTDHVMNILPASASTERFFTAERLSKLKRTAVFYNIGRGTTVDQAALLDVLQRRTIRAAYLDVTDPEPLPPEHPLWQLNNCHITPHSAGGHDGEFHRLVQHFLTNLKRFDQGEPLHDRVI